MLEGKNVVITGGGSGVGRAATILFARNGANVICADINPDWAAESARLAREAGGKAEAMACDVSKSADVNAIVARCVESFGRLDVMYNNAGVATASDGKPHTLIEQGDDDFDRLVSINFRGVVYGCQAAVRRFIAQGNGGTIVNTASVAGLVGWGGVMYGATKGAVVQLTRGLAIEVAKHNIRVNSVCPAGMVTNFGRTGGAGFNDLSDVEDLYGKNHPLGRVITPEDCAEAAMFLASDRASNITGVMLPVDGGYVAA
jgi:NAD(P)-dependent dehydrogenase (short-subunit alcohol dehydrogenase family)